MAGAGPAIDLFAAMQPEAGQPPCFMGLSGLEAGEIDERLAEVVKAMQDFIVSRRVVGPYVLAVQFEKTGRLSVAHGKDQNAEAAIAKGWELADMEPEEFMNKAAEFYSGVAPFPRLR